MGGVRVGDDQEAVGSEAAFEGEQAGVRCVAVAVVLAGVADGEGAARQGRLRAAQEREVL